MTISSTTENGMFLFQPEGAIRVQLDKLNHEDQLVVKNHYADLIARYIHELGVLCRGEEIDSILRRARGEKEEPFDEELENDLYDRASRDAHREATMNKPYTPAPDYTQSDYQLQ